jgi:hypothetical protein
MFGFDFIDFARRRDDQGFTKRERLRTASVNRAT